MKLLKFSRGNAKLSSDIYTFSLPSGFSCPSANECLSKADKTTGKIKDGPNTKFRCFSASQEALYKNVRDQRWYNFGLLKVSKNMKELILKSLPKAAKKVRIHVAGDMFSQEYFDAWMSVAKAKPDVLFYAYTKSLNFWAKRKNSIPPNFVLTASEGGRLDDLIKSEKLRSAKVVFSKAEAKKLKLKIDHDDSHAMKNGPSFSLLLHGTQPKNTIAAKAMSVLRSMGENGYPRKIKLKVLK